MMCLATPLKIKKIEGQTATVEHDGKDFPVNIQLIPAVKVGDWIMAHGEIGINTIPEHEALDILRLIDRANQAS